MKIKLFLAFQECPLSMKGTEISGPGLSTLTAFT